MYGAILGDMIGAPYEFDRGSQTRGCTESQDMSRAAWRKGAPKAKFEICVKRLIQR